jgi:hypothetical protein
MEKKNTDYSASAVNLVNPIETKELLEELQKMKANQLILKEQVDKLIPQELKDRMEINLKWMVEQETRIRLSIDTFGSFQDLEDGWYAVKQRKVSKSYNAEAFEKIYPQYTPAIIIKAVDTTKLTGLIKGGLLDEAGLKNNGVIKESESFAYIIK